MPTRILREPRHADALADLLRGLKLPVTVSWTKGASLSAAQRRLSFRWYQDVSRQLGDQTSEDVRAHCKVTFGVPILSGETAFRDDWSRSLGRFNYDAQREIVKRLQIPVTSLMTVPQMTEYLDQVHREYASQGLRLTDPEALKYEQEFGPLEPVA